MVTWLIDWGGGTGVVGFWENLPWAVIIPAVLVAFTTSLYAGQLITGKKSNQAIAGRRTRTVKNENYKNEHIRILDLIAEDDPYLKDCNFEKCVIYGPAMLIFQANTTFFGNTRFPGVAQIRDAIINPGDKTNIYGAVALTNCLFRDCIFKEIGIIGDDAVQKSLEHAFRK